MAPSKQYLWIVRYGLTEFPLVENQGPYDSDINPAEGITHAKSIAKRLTENGTSLPMRIYTSPFLRCVHTADIIAKQTAATTRCEDGLYEWIQPSLLVDLDGKRTYPKSLEEHAERFTSIDKNYESLNPVANLDEWENEESLLHRCGTTVDEILKLEKENNFAIVAHAPCDIAIVLHLLGKGLKDSTLPPLALGGVTRFSRELDSNAWVLDFYGATDHMPGAYKDGLKHWTLPSLTK